MAKEITTCAVQGPIATSDEEFKRMPNISPS